MDLTPSLSFHDALAAKDADGVSLVASVRMALGRKPYRDCPNGNHRWYVVYEPELHRECMDCAARMAAVPEMLRRDFFI